MARITLPLLLLLLPIFFIAGTVESGMEVQPRAIASLSADTNFIKTSCNTTLYPAVCIQSLSVFASAIQQIPYHLAKTSLSVSLARAQSTKTFVSKLATFKGLKETEYAAVKDCFEEMGDSVDRLNKSVQEIEQIHQAKGQDFLWRMSNVQTWVSAALTDANTCVDGFESQALDGRVKAAVKARAVNVAHVTSNALAFVNQYAQKH